MSNSFFGSAAETRTEEDLDRAVRAIAEHFGTDTVFIVGSQSVLLEWPDAPVIMRTSNEIDAYPANAEQWGQAEDMEASEEINALFGLGSQFHDTHGFFIDGVDEYTAKMPADWRSRAIVREVDVYGKTATAIAPSPHDVAVSKLHRLEEKDADYIRARHALRPFNLGQLREYFLDSDPDEATSLRGCTFILSLAA